MMMGIIYPICGITVIIHVHTVVVREHPLPLKAEPVRYAAEKCVKLAAEKCVKLAVGPPGNTEPLLV